MLLLLLNWFLTLSRKLVLVLLLLEEEGLALLLTIEDDVMIFELLEDAEDDTADVEYLRLDEGGRSRDFFDWSWMRNANFIQITF